MSRGEEDVRTKIGTRSDFPDGKGTNVEVDGISVAVFNLDGELYALQNTCPHQRLPIHRAGHESILPDSDKTLGEVDCDTKTIRCPWHRMKIDAETGDFHPGEQRVATYDVEVEGDDVYLEI